jgi:glycerol-3-phosphate acyltransferase PlsX
MKIIVDMMGGDNAPLAVLEGTAQAVKEYGVQILGVGNEELVRRTAADNNIPLDGIELVNCTEVIEMCDEPARAIRQKKDSSIVVGLNLLKEGKGDAFVSAGSTGALHVGASLIVRSVRLWPPWCPPKSRLTCCWTAVPTWSAARRCWPPLPSWAAAM